MENFQALTWSQIFGHSLGIKRLFEHLDAQLHPKDLQQTIKLLAQAAIRLYKLLTKKEMSLYDADWELLTTPGYSQGPLLQQILELKKQNNLLVLFNRQAFQLIYYLAIHDVDYSHDSQESDLPPIAQYTMCSLVGMFLAANEILLHLKKNRRLTSEESAEIRDFYSSCLIDPAGAIGRSGLFYDRPYFNNELQKRIGVSVRDVQCIVFTHFTHIMTKDPAVFDFTSSFKWPEISKPSLQTISNVLSLRYKSKKIEFSELMDQLDCDLALKKMIRGKPLLELDGWCYCLCPELLGSPLADLPYHLIWTDMQSKKEKVKPLRDARGEAFHEYIVTISEMILGKDICNRAYLKKDGEFGDLLIDLPEGKLMVEWKVADPLDTAKSGNIAEIIKRFILPPERKGSGNRKNPGPLQVMDAAMDYRKTYDFKDVMYTAVGYYGRFPEVDIFDELYNQSIKSAETCCEYEKNNVNVATMLWNSFSWELMLSAIKQSASPDKLAADVLHSMLKALKPHASQPSQSSKVIEEYLKKNGLKLSVAPIFMNEILGLAEECRSKFRIPQINSPEE